MESLVSGFVVTAAFHPLAYAKTLVQLGYEPIAPKVTRTIFGKEVLCYPNMLQYVKYIKSIDGFFGLYRGLIPKIAGGFVGSFASGMVQRAILPPPGESSEEGGHGDAGEDTPDEPKDIDIVASVQAFCIKTSKESICRCVGIVVAHPFHVMMIRSMAQFVGREVVYNNPISAIKDVYENEGISGFFSGLVPRLLGEILTLWGAGCISYLINTYILEEMDVRKTVKPFAELMIGHFTYPFTLVSTCMAVNGSSLILGQPPITPIYHSWTDCYKHLSRRNEIKRGAGMFLRYYHGPTVLQKGHPIPAKSGFLVAN